MKSSLADRSWSKNEGLERSFHRLIRLSHSQSLHDVARTMHDASTNAQPDCTNLLLTSSNDGMTLHIASNVQ